MNLSWDNFVDFFFLVGSVWSCLGKKMFLEPSPTFIYIYFHHEKFEKNDKGEKENRKQKGRYRNKNIK